MLQLELVSLHINTTLAARIILNGQSVVHFLSVSDKKVNKAVLFTSFFAVCLKNKTRKSEEEWSVLGRGKILPGSVDEGSFGNYFGNLV